MTKMRSTEPAPYDLSRFDDFKDDKSFLLQRNPSDPNWRTVVVLGTGRSGTTMTAGVLMLLGVEFGDQTDGRLGDKEISGCFRQVYQSRLRWRLITLRAAFRKVIAARQTRWTRFGFKSPDLGPFLWLLGGTISAPVYLVSSRNLFETSFGFARHVGGRWPTSYFTVTLIQCFLTLFALRTRKPVLLFSYEAAVKNPERFVDTLCEFLAIKPDPAKREKAIAHIDPKPGYRMLKRTHGHVDIATKDQIAGWVMDASGQFDAVTVRVLTGNLELIRTVANLERVDVAKAGHHATGHCGFSARFSPTLSDTQLANLRILVDETGHEFWRKDQ